MTAFSAILSSGRRKWLAGTCTVVLLASAACSLILDRTSTQCQSDGDCARFGGRPSCQNGVCADLGLVPKDCFYGTPMAPSDFYNQCSPPPCLAFDDCSRLGICGGADGPPPIPPPPLEAGASGDAASASDADPGLPSCSDPQNRPKVVYVTGSSNFPPLLSKLAPLIINQTGYTPVFLTTNSCTGVKAMLSSQPADRTISDPARGSAVTKYAQFFDQTGTATPCLLGGTQVVDVGESDVFSEDCDPFKSASMYPDTIESYGPIQAMAFIVHRLSDEHTISENAARAVFGTGGNSDMNIPWTDPNRYFVRNSGTGTQQMIGHAIGLNAKAFWGVDMGSADRVYSTVRTLGGLDAKQGIGIISVDYYDKDRDNLRALAYRAKTQECAYLPDSNEQSYDKRNVRDGHYPIWGPLHFLSTVGNDAAAAFLGSASVMTTDRSAIDAFIGASLVPLCAMNVKRNSEIGPLSSFTPGARCDCYFEATAPVAHGQPMHVPDGCVACSADTGPCPSDRPSCIFGYCEPVQ